MNYIHLDRSKYLFFLSEEKSEHPLDDYYFKTYDLSINSLINLKWIYWGFFFYSSLKDTLENELIDPEFKFKSYVSSSIQTNFEFSKKKNVLFIDNTEINSEENFKDYIKKYDNFPLNENIKIHFKLKLNIDEFIMLNTYLHPVILKKIGIIRHKK